MRTLLRLIVGPALALSVALPALAIDDAHRDRAREMSRKAIDYLRARQDEKTGGWSVPEPGSRQPHLPGVTALVLHGMLLDPRVETDDGAVRSGVEYLLSHRQPDGGIYDRMLPSYNTSLALSALSRVDSPAAKAAIPEAQDFLRRLQWSEGSDPQAGGKEASTPVDRDHPFYGGVGYGKHGRPDGSNLNLMLQALQDSGVSPEDPAVRRAVVFLERLQMLDEVNDMPYAQGSAQGGFIYSTVPNAESVDSRPGQSQAGTIEETLDDGTIVSRLRAYGSMTYAGFKSYLYADLPRDDLRVRAALDWIQRNYTLEENPGLGTDGLYYYFVTFSRALDAWGEPTLLVSPSGDAQKAQRRDWANDLIDRLAGLQNEDGSFRSVDDRWMENDPVLITAYALVALGHAAD